MQAEFWHERWQQNQIGFHQDGINAHLQEFWADLDTPSAGRVFVPLCGKSRDMLWLRTRGHEVVGVEISPKAVEDFFAENHLDPEISDQGPFKRWETDGLAILCGDFFDLTAHDLAAVTSVYDRASLVALPPDMRAQYANHIAVILPPAVGMLLVSMEYPQDEMRGPPFSVHEPEVCELYQRGYAISRLFTADVLAENPQFRQRGLTRLEEKVYRLTPRQTGT